MLRRIGCCAALLLFAMVVGFALPASAAPTVTTDKSDYPLGDTASIIGAGGATSEVLTFQMNH